MEVIIFRMITKTKGSSISNCSLSIRSSFNLFAHDIAFLHYPFFPLDNYLLLYDFALIEKPLNADDNSKFI